MNHKLVVGFLTHCGWNSVLESLSTGVSMICWPNGVDQQTNVGYVCAKWKVRLEADGGDVKRDDIEGVIRELLGGEKGKQLKERAMEVKALAEDAASPTGLSTKSLDELFGQVLL